MKFNKSTFVLILIAILGLLSFSTPAWADTAPPAPEQSIVQTVVSTATSTATKAVTDAVKSVLTNSEPIIASAATKVSAVTSNVNSAVSSTKSTVATNINEAVLNILRGVQSAGSDIYTASKSAITQAVDFTMTQAPIVVLEFIHWKLAESVIWLIFWLIIVCILLGISRGFNKASKSEKTPDTSSTDCDKGDMAGFKWLFRVIALVVLAIALVTQGLKVAKIVIAPRVYLIEYVVSSVQAYQHPQQ